MRVEVRDSKEYIKYMWRVGDIIRVKYGSSADSQYYVVASNASISRLINLDTGTKLDINQGERATGNNHATSLTELMSMFAKEAKYSGFSYIRYPKEDFKLVLEKVGD